MSALKEKFYSTFNYVEGITKDKEVALSIATMSLSNKRGYL